MWSSPLLPPAGACAHDRLTPNVGQQKGAKSTTSRFSAIAFYCIQTLSGIFVKTSRLSSSCIVQVSGGPITPPGGGAASVGVFRMMDMVSSPAEVHVELAQVAAR